MVGKVIVYLLQNPLRTLSMDWLEIIRKKFCEAGIAEKTRHFRAIHSVGVLVCLDAKRYEVSDIVVMSLFFIHHNRIKNSFDTGDRPNNA